MPRSAPHYVGPECGIRQRWFAEWCSKHQCWVHRCPVCDRQFHAKRRDAVTCSDRCRQRHARNAGPLRDALTHQNARNVTAAVTPPPEARSPDTPIVEVRRGYRPGLLTAGQVDALARVIAAHPDANAILIRFIR